MHNVCHTRLQEKGSLNVLKTLVLDCLHLPRCNNPPSSPLPLLLPLENETNDSKEKTWSWGEAERRGQPGLNTPASGPGETESPSLKKSVLRLATTEGAGLTSSEPPVSDHEQGWTTPPNADSSSLGGHLLLIFIF